VEVAVLENGLFMSACVELHQSTKGGFEPQDFFFSCVDESERKMDGNFSFLSLGGGGWLVEVSGGPLSSFIFGEWMGGGSFSEDDSSVLVVVGSVLRNLLVVVVGFCLVSFEGCWSGFEGGGRTIAE